MPTKHRKINKKAVSTVAIKNKNKFKKKFKKKSKDPWAEHNGKLYVKEVKLLKKINGNCYVYAVTVKYVKGSIWGMNYKMASTFKTGIGMSRSKTLAKKRGKQYATALAKKRVEEKLKKWEKMIEKWYMKNN